MQSDQVRPLNYSAHAIEDLLKLANDLSDVTPRSALVIRRLVDMLRASVKFILPNCCNLIEPESLKQSHLDMARLPYRCVAFEAPWVKDDDIDRVGEFVQTPATKRIALCWEPDSQNELLPGLHSVLQTFKQGGIFIVPIYWTPKEGKWLIGMGGAFLPYGGEVSVFDSDTALPASKIAHEAAIEAGLAKERAKQFRCEPFYFLPEFFESTVAQYQGDRDKAYAQIILDVRDEVQTVVQVCSVINCSNVATGELIPSPASNKKRTSKGTQPFFTYKVLELTEERRGTLRDSGGTHASPRTHLRRGHLRQLGDKAVWVRPALINAAATSGAVVKDYAVRDRQPVRQ